jgi:hypothetical protein
MVQGRHRLFLFAWAIGLWLFTCQPPAFSADPAANAINFKHIVIDIRGSRGGHGDVAAGYLTALDLMRRHKYSGPITFVADEASLRIIGKLVGHSTKNGESLFGGQAHIYDVNNIPQSLPAADLYLSLSSPNGVERFTQDFRYVDSAEKKTLGIPISEKTVRITQTVMGNTERASAENLLGLVQVGEQVSFIKPAGLGAQESGIYFDPVAHALRGKGKAEIRDYLQSNIGHIKDENVRKALHDIVSQKALNGSRLGLVYGITAQEAKSQFESYLAGLSDQSLAYTLVTPSGFKEENMVDPELRRRLIVLNAGDKIPIKAEPGKIYILKTGSVAHRTFVGLLAYSELTPIVAGDGALSAAIAIGKPFVMTQVGSNNRNAANVGAHLKSAEASQSKNLAGEIFSTGNSNLIRAQELPILAAEYSELISQIPFLTDSMLNAAIQAQNFTNHAFQKLKCSGMYLAIE